jgi:hypothetical protein
MLANYQAGLKRGKKMKLPNEEQQTNLRTLANYLLSGDLKAKFDMFLYSELGHLSYGVDCGTVGCAVGHGPYAGIEKYPGEEWGKYANRVFGSGESKIFSHLWASRWKQYDNTPEGTANRILAFLDQMEKGTLTEEYLEENTPFYL